jgi:hypothetical protein
MHKPILFWSLMGLFAFGLSSCSNDFRITSEWRDIPVVYGLLNHRDTAHYVRVEKAYLDETTNALVLAQNPDSLYYPENEIQVELVDVNQNSVVAVMQRVEVQAEGIFVDTNSTFVTSPKYVYKAKATLNPARDYAVRIKNVDGSEKATAQTPMIPTMIPVSPVDGANTALSFRYPSAQPTVTIIWRNPENAHYYDLNLVVRYRESYNGTVVNKSVVWRARPGVVNVGGQNTTAQLRGESFFSFMSSALSPAPTGMTRCITGTDIRIDAGSKDLFDYIRVIDAAQGLAGGFNPPPPFTNVQNGVGLLAARQNLTIPDIRLTAETLDSLSTGVYTRNLGFLPSTQSCQ